MTIPCSATTSSTASRRQRADEPLDAGGPAQLRADVAAVAPQRPRRDEHLAGGEPRGERGAVLARLRRRSRRTGRRRARRRRASRQPVGELGVQRGRGVAPAPPATSTPRSETAQRTAATAGAESPPLGASRSDDAPARRAPRRRAGPPWRDPWRTSGRRRGWRSSPTRPAALSAGSANSPSASSTITVACSRRRAHAPQQGARQDGAARVGGRGEHDRRRVAGGRVRRHRDRAAAGRGDEVRAAAASPASRRARRPPRGRSARSSSPAPCPSATCSGASSKRAATASRAGGDVRVGVERAAQREGGGVDGLGVRRLEPPGAREVERLDAAERAALLLLPAGAQLGRDLLGVHRLELLVVVAEARHQRGAIEGAGPWSTTSQNVNATAATIAVTMKIRAEHPLALVVPGGAAQEPPEVVEPSGQHQRDDHRSRSTPRKATVMPSITLSVR